MNIQSTRANRSTFQPIAARGADIKGTPESQGTVADGYSSGTAQDNQALVAPGRGFDLGKAVTIAAGVAGASVGVYAGVATGTTAAVVGAVTGGISAGATGAVDI